MKLERVVLRGLRGLSPVELRLTASDGSTPPFVITGPSGAGKTTVLEAIMAAKEAWAPYGSPPQASAFCLAGGVGGLAQLDWRAADGEAASVAWQIGAGAAAAGGLPAGPLQRRAAAYTFAADAFKVEYAHAGRSFARRSLVRLGGPRVERGRRLRAIEGKYDWVRGYLEWSATERAGSTERELRERGIVLAESDRESADPFGHAVAVLSPSLRWVGVERAREGATESQLACMFARRAGPSVELDELTGGERAVVLVAAAYAALGLRHALLLVDLPEQGLHPEDHASFFGRLGELFADGQLIAATTSAGILRAVPSERILLLR